MKTSLLLIVFFISMLSFSQEEVWVKAEGEITEIKTHAGKRLRSSGVIKFHLENGVEQLGTTELFRIPFIGGMNSVGDKITIHYNSNNPALIETTIGRFISSYGMYILIFLGIIYSIKPFLKKKKVKVQ